DPGREGIEGRPRRRVAEGGRGLQGRLEVRVEAGDGRRSLGDGRGGRSAAPPYAARRIETWRVHVKYDAASAAFATFPRSRGRWRWSPPPRCAALNSACSRVGRTPIACRA